MSHYLVPHGLPEGEMRDPRIHWNYPQNWARAAAVSRVWADRVGAALPQANGVDFIKLD